MNEEEPKINSLEDLILRGAVEVASVDEEGNFMYRITDKAKEVAKDFVDRSVDHFYDELKELWVLGFINMDIESENPVITLSDKALDTNHVKTLSPKLIRSLSFIVKALRIQ